MGCLGDKTTEVKKDKGRQENKNVDEKEKNNGKEESRDDYVVLKRNYEEVGVEVADGEEGDEDDAEGEGGYYERHHEEVGVEAADGEECDEEEAEGEGGEGRDRYDYAVLERDYEVIGVEAADGEECDEEEGCEPEDVY